MATVIQKNYSNLRPIRFNLKDRDRSLDLSIPSKYATVQGNFFLEYNFLADSNDVKNKNSSEIIRSFLLKVSGR